MRIDAPELRGMLAHLGEMARAYVQERTAGRTVQVAVTRTWPDKYGRVLGEVIIDGVNLSDELVTRGFAQPWNGRAATKPYKNGSWRSPMSTINADALQHLLEIAPLE